MSAIEDLHPDGDLSPRSRARSDLRSLRSALDAAMARITPSLRGGEAAAAIQTRNARAGSPRSARDDDEKEWQIPRERPAGVSASAAEPQATSLTSTMPASASQVPLRWRAWNAVATWLGEGIAAHEIGLFVRTPQLVVRARAAIDGLAGAAGMVTAQMSLAKGLEFRAVVVMACDEGVLPLDERVADAADEAELDDIYETERRLLYVACTRAREHLLLTGVTPVSEYLADLQTTAG